MRNSNESKSLENFQPTEDMLSRLSAEMYNADLPEGIGDVVEVRPEMEGARQVGSQDSESDLEESFGSLTRFMVLFIYLKQHG